MNRDELFKGWDDSVRGLERVAEAMKNDDGKRIAFVYVGDKYEYPITQTDYFDRQDKSQEIGKEIRPYDNRQWAMVDQEDGKGAKLTLIDTALPSVEEARQWGYKEEDYKPVGSVNIYSDILGYYSSLNTFENPALEGDQLEKKVQEWYLHSYQDDKNIIAAKKINAEYTAKKARKDFEDYKP